MHIYLINLIFIESDSLVSLQINQFKSMTAAGCCCSLLTESASDSHKIDRSLATGASKIFSEHLEPLFISIVAMVLNACRSWCSYVVDADAETRVRLDFFGIIFQNV